MDSKSFCSDFGTRVGQPKIRRPCVASNGVPKLTRMASSDRLWRGVIAWLSSLEQNKPRIPHFSLRHYPWIPRVPFKLPGSEICGPNDSPIRVSPHEPPEPAKAKETASRHHHPTATHPRKVNWQLLFATAPGTWVSRYIPVASSLRLLHAGHRKRRNLLYIFSSFP